MSEPLHVCFLTLSFGENSAGGVMNHMVGLARALHAREVSVSVICPSYGEPWRYTHDGFMDVIGIQEAIEDWELAPAMLGFGERCEVALLDLHREKPIDVIHLHDRAPFMGARRASDALGVPLVYTAHSVLSADAQGLSGRPLVLSRWLERWIAHSGTPIIAVSEWAREAMVRLGARRDRTRVIYNAVDAEVFEFRAMAERARDEILFVGRLDPDKGFDVLLQAVQSLAQTHELKLIAIGSGERESQYRAMARELGIADRVDFRGQLEQDEVIAAYQHASVCVMPSRAEPFGMVMLEAMACGAPFIGSAVGGIAEVAEHEKTALLVPPADAPALAAAISRMLNDRELTHDLTANARQMIEQRFTWDRVADETQGFYSMQRERQSPAWKDGGRRTEDQTSLSSVARRRS